MAVCGLGFGLFQSPNNRTIVSAAPKPRSGAAGGMLATARLLGQTAGAVAVGVAFHLAGVRITPSLLFAASIAAVVAAAISLTRMGVAPPSRVAVYRPILD
jgi:DHA2 family multidrug resistance protein-like MFS transporter